MLSKEIIMSEDIVRVIYLSEPGEAAFLRVGGIDHTDQCLLDNK